MAYSYAIWQSVKTRNSTAVSLLAVCLNVNRKLFFQCSMATKTRERTYSDSTKKLGKGSMRQQDEWDGQSSFQSSKFSPWPLARFAQPRFIRTLSIQSNVCPTRKCSESSPWVPCVACMVSVSRPALPAVRGLSHFFRKLFPSA